MRIVVLVKEVPDTYGERKLDPATGLADRSASESVVDEIGERALEVALTHADANADTEIVVLMMGPATVPGSLRKTLALGAHRAVHVLDDLLAGADLALTSRTLAAAVNRIEADLVIAGNLSTDGSAGVMPAMIAEHLGWPHATNLGSVELADGSVSGRRVLEAGSVRSAAELPAVISITEALPDARFSNFKGILAAKKKPVDTWTLADLGVAVPTTETTSSIVVAIAERASRGAGVTIVDDGDAGTKLAEYLIANRLV